MIVWQGRRIGVDLVDETGPDGRSRTFEVVRFGHGVAILPVLSDGRIVLIRQRRPAVGESILEIPAGKIEAGEEILVAAARELSEETGISGGRLVLMASIQTTPGFCDEVIHLVLATGGVLERAHPEEGEWIEERLFLTGQEARQLVLDGDIRDGKTLVALSRYFLFLEKSG